MWGCGGCWVEKSHVKKIVFSCESKEKTFLGVKLPILACWRVIVVSWPCIKLILFRNLPKSHIWFGVGCIQRGTLNASSAQSNSGFTFFSKQFFISMIETLIWFDFVYLLSIDTCSTVTCRFLAWSQWSRTSRRYTRNQWWNARTEWPLVIGVE